MWILTFLCPALFAAFAEAGPYVYRNLNATTSPTLSSSLYPAAAVSSSGSSLPSLTSSSTIATSYSLSSTSSSSSAVSSSASLTNSPVSLCTGCVLEAINPITTFFVESEQSTSWTSVVVTQTILFEYITYMLNNRTVDTVVTESHTLDVTQTVVGPAGQVTHTAPFFTFEAAPGNIVTLAAGPTYVAYLDIWGGLDFVPTDAALPFATATPEPTCIDDVEPVGLSLTNPSDYQYLIETYSSGAPEYTSGAPLSLPSSMIEFLKKDPKVQAWFNTANIATCTLRTPKTQTSVGVGASSVISRMSLTTTSPVATYVSTDQSSYSQWHPGGGGHPDNPPGDSSEPQSPSASAPLGLTTPTSTYISTTYSSTSTHVTRDGCLRCSTPVVAPPVPNFTGGGVIPTVEAASVVPPLMTPTANLSPGNAEPGNDLTANPQMAQNNPTGPKETVVTVGGTVVPVMPAQPTGAGQQVTTIAGENQNIQFGQTTLTPGEVITTNGVAVSVPSNGGGSIIVVGASTITINGQNNAPTGPPVLAVGGKTVTANSQGQFVVDSQTLKPGGPVITVDGSTLSLGASGSVAVVNGITQTLSGAPLPTEPPVLALTDHQISATVIGGTTAFVVAPGQTLLPGGVLTVGGTTLSMPNDGSGSTIVINGQTSTLQGEGLPVFTFNSQSITATIEDGTEKFILGPGQTLVPSGVLTVDGTTLSFPAGGSGSMIVVDGKTSTLSGGGLPIITISSESLTASVLDGTTAFVLGPGQTLTPGGVLTVDGSTFSMPASASGSVVVINGVTSTLSNALITSAPALTINGQTYLATVQDGTAEYVLGNGTTLKPGAAITINGTTFSLSPQETALIINGETSSIPKLPASISASTTLASYSNSSSTVSQTSSSSSISTTSQLVSSTLIASDKQGGTAGRAEGLDKWMEGVVIGVAGWLLMLL